MDAAVARLHCQWKKWSVTLKSTTMGVGVAAVTMQNTARVLADKETELIAKRRGLLLT